MEIVVIITTYLFSCALAYLFGSINSAIIVTKIISGKDIRNYGSKNAGMTNVLRNFGKIPALFTLIGDFGKGILAVILLRFFASLAVGGEHLEVISYLAAISVILGHIFPFFYGFKGGKGILTTAGILLVLDPFVLLSVLGVFIITLIIMRYVSLSSICAAIACPVSVILIHYFLSSRFPEIIIYTAFYTAVAGIVIYMHRGNIKRLLGGNEPKIGSKNSQK